MRAEAGGEVYIVRDDDDGQAVGLGALAENLKDRGRARHELRGALVQKLSAKEEWIRESFKNSPPPNHRER